MSLRKAKVVLEVILLDRDLANVRKWLRSARDYLAKYSARHLVRPENNIQGEWVKSAQAHDKLMVKLEVGSEEPPPLEATATAGPDGALYVI